MEQSPSFLNPGIMDKNPFCCCQHGLISDWTQHSFMLLADVLVSLWISKVDNNSVAWWLDGRADGRAVCVSYYIFNDKCSPRDQICVFLFSHNIFCLIWRGLEHHLAVSNHLITNGCVSKCYKIGCYLLVAAIKSLILRNRSGPDGAVQ